MPSVCTVYNTFITWFFLHSTLERQKRETKKNLETSHIESK